VLLGLSGGNTSWTRVKHGLAVERAPDVMRGRSSW